MQGGFFAQVAAVDAFLGLGLALALGALIGQAAGGHGQAADEGGFDHQPDHQQVEGFDQAVAELQGGVEVAQADGHAEAQGQGDKTDADGLAQR